MAWSYWKQRAIVPPGDALLVGPAAPAHTPRARTASSTAYLLYVLIGGVTLVALSVAPDTVDAVWTWFRGLPAMFQVAGWVVLLPWVGVVALWESVMPDGFRLFGIALITLAAILAYAPRDEV